jgi:hypothetical protein
MGKVIASLTSVRAVATRGSSVAPMSNIAACKVRTSLASTQDLVLSLRFFAAPLEEPESLSGEFFGPGSNRAGPGSQAPTCCHPTRPCSRRGSRSGSSHEGVGAKISAWFKRMVRSVTARPALPAWRRRLRPPTLRGRQAAAHQAGHAGPDRRTEPPPSAAYRPRRLSDLLPRVEPGQDFDSTVGWTRPAVTACVS